MDKEGNSLNGQDESKTGMKPAVEGQNNGALTRARVKSDTKPRKKKAGSKNKLESAAWSTIAQIGVALIGLIGTITVAWFSYKSNHPDPLPIPTFTPTALLSPTPVFTDEPIRLTDMPSPVSLPSLTSTPYITVPPTETATIELSPAPKLIVLLTANKSAGNKPLKVKMDARESYLTTYDGQKYVCRNGPCSYSWRVYFNDQQVGKADNSRGTFDYTFGKRGTYKVTVWICRGQDKVDCGSGAIQITAT
jgi:hypothetical protein